MLFHVTVFLLAAFLVFGTAASKKPDLDPAKFKETVLEDSHAWMVEFYSAMCGGCQEFAPTWDRIAKAFDDSSNGGALMSGKVNIDDNAGLQLAEELGVLDDGVPHVRLFKSKGDKKGTIIVKSKEIYAGRFVVCIVRLIQCLTFTHSRRLCARVYQDHEQADKADVR